MPSISKLVNNSIAGTDSPIEFADDEGKIYQLVPAGDTVKLTKSGSVHGGFLRPTAAKTAAYTCTVEDCGTLFTTRGATGAVTFTLPAVSGNAGLWYEFEAAADQNMTVSAPAGTLVAFNNAGATSIAFSTLAEKIGGAVKVTCDGTKWLAQVMLGAETQTPTIA